MRDDRHDGEVVQTIVLALVIALVLGFVFGLSTGPWAWFPK